MIRITQGLEKIPLAQRNRWKAIPSVPVELDQRGCFYRPRVVAAQVGQEVIFINSDPLFHNVRSVTEKNKFFNLAMPKKDQKISKIFQKAEIFVQAKCSVHPWMKAYIAVMDHPFFSVSDSSGKFHIKNLPVGSYTLEAWHEIFGTQEKIITIKNGEKTQYDFEFNNSKNYHL